MQVHKKPLLDIGSICSLRICHGRRNCLNDVFVREYFLHDLDDIVQLRLSKFEWFIHRIPGIILTLGKKVILVNNSSSIALYFASASGASLNAASIASLEITNPASETM